MQNLNGKVAVITGAGSGMGKELAIQLAGKGAKVALNDWNGENLQATVDNPPRRLDADPPGGRTS